MYQFFQYFYMYKLSQSDFQYKQIHTKIAHPNVQFKKNNIF